MINSIDNSHTLQLAGLKVFCFCYPLLLDDVGLQLRPFQIFYIFQLLVKLLAQVSYFLLRYLFLFLSSAWSLICDCGSITYVCSSYVLIVFVFLFLFCRKHQPWKSCCWPL